MRAGCGKAGAGAAPEPAAGRHSPNLTAAPGVLFGYLKGFAISDRFIPGFTFLPVQKPCLDNAQQHPCLVQTGIKVSRCLFACTSRGIGPKTFNRVSLSFPSWRLPPACFEAGLCAIRGPAGLQHTQPSSPTCGPASTSSLCKTGKNAPAHWTLYKESRGGCAAHGCSWRIALQAKGTLWHAISLNLR